MKRILISSTFAIGAVVSAAAAGLTDLVSATTLPAADGDHDGDDRLGHFQIIRSAKAGEVLRGIAFAPEERGDDGCK